MNCSSVLFCFAVKQYQTYGEISRGLRNREIQGALIDLYVVSNEEDLNSNPNLRVFEVFDYKKTYGVVLAGPSMKLEKCFLEFVQLHNGDISHQIEKTVKTLGVCQIKIRWQTKEENQRGEKYSHKRETFCRDFLFRADLYGINWKQRTALDIRQI